jgi:ankyrin repeat protein
MDNEKQIPNLASLVSVGKDEEVIRLLREQPELKDVVDGLGHTLFRNACQSNLISVCNYLVSIDAPLSIVDPAFGDSVLDLSIRNGYDEVFRLLLKLGNSPNIGRPAISAIHRGGSEGLECLRLLIQHGLEVNQVLQFSEVARMSGALLISVPGNQSLLNYFETPVPRLRLNS